mmetsp:Transcript_41256/g.128023  ORF Transcript_41256/g.128023 Transcript_41256/m.128023 type:complete len:763 (-) Transcript_41256:2-2290(-)
MLVERARLELGGRVVGQLRRHDLVGGLEELREVVEDLRVLGRDEGGRQALVARAARAADAVRVVLDGLRHVEVDHLRHALDVQASARHVRGDEDVVPALLEGVHRPLSLLLALAAVDRADAVAAVVQGLGQHVHGLLLVHEYDDGRLGADEQLLQSLLLLGLADELQPLLDVLLGVAGVADAHDGGAPQEGPRHALDGRGHGGTEHLRDAVLPVPGLGLELLLQRLVLVLGLHVGAGDGQERSPHVVLEAQVDHLVGLVDHDVVALVQDRVPLVQRVAEAAGCREAALHALPQLVGLLLGVAPADHADHAAVAVLGELPRLLLDLDHELAARRQDDGVGAVLGRGVVERRELLDVREDGQHVRRGLAATGLGHGDQVAHLARYGDDLHLDRRRLGVAHLVHGLQELPGQRALGPDAHGHRHAAAADVDLEVLAEDAPVARRHLVHGLVGPVDLVVVLALDVALLEGERLLRRLDEGRHVLSSVLRALGDELLVEAVVLALLAHVDARAVAATEEELRLQALGVERVVVAAHGVVVGVPLEVEDVSELLGGLLHLLLGFLHAEVVPLDELQLLLRLPLAPLRLRQLQQVHLRQGARLHEVVLLLALLQPLLFALLAFSLAFLLAPLALALALLALALALALPFDLLLQQEVLPPLRGLLRLLLELVFLAAGLLLRVPLAVALGDELDLRRPLLLLPLGQHLLQGHHLLLAALGVLEALGAALAAAIAPPLEVLGAHGSRGPPRALQSARGRRPPAAAGEWAGP